MLKYFYISILVCLYLTVNCQVQVRLSDSNGFTPKDLINNIFLGDGVSVLEVKYDGDNKSVGYFSNGQNAISLERGIIMATGDASHASQYNSNTINSSTSSGNSIKDQELSNAIGNSNLNDIARFEITFIPFFDSISFRYVFASEEYPSYSCDKYNDVFGFFISGPDPAGGSYVNRNIALIPGTNEVVSINNVHPAYLNNCSAKNVQFYNENLLGSNTMVYNGYLDVFSANAKVIPCAVYKIKLAIADVVDNLYDSAVFLEAKSFSADGMKVTVETPSFDGVISEGCQPAKIRFEYNVPVKEDFNLNLRQITGFSGFNATPVTDFNSLPVQGAIKRGSRDFQFVINALEDNLTENDELIAIEYQKDKCNLDTLFIKITDNKLINILLTDTILVCQNTTVNVGAKLPDNYQLANEKTFKSNQQITLPGSKGTSVTSGLSILNVNPDLLKTAMIKEVCIDKLFGKSLYDLDIYLVSPDNSFIEISTDNGFRSSASSTVDSMINTCFTPDAVLGINNGNAALGTYFPLNPSYRGYFQPEGTWKDLENTKVNGEWGLFLFRDEEGWTTTLESWHITFRSNYNLSYNWTPDNGISCTKCLNPDIFPDHSTFYNISLIDTYGCVVKDSIYADVNLKEDIIDIVCDSVSTDHIRFLWSSSGTDDIYEVKLNNSGDWQKVENNQLSLNGLGFSEKINIQVRVEDQLCQNNIKSQQCETFPCPLPQIRILSRKDIDCYGKKNGIIELEAFGTKGPYSYRYKGLEQNSGLFTGLGAGEDTIFVKDGSACEIPYIFKIAGPQPYNVQLIKTDISCFGLNDGKITAIVNGGNGNYKFKWVEKTQNFLKIQQNIDQLKGGKYFLTILDSRNCQYLDSVEITEPDALVIKDSIVNISCKGYSTGKIIIDCSGGTPPYSYSWITPVGVSQSKDIINLPAGNYKITVTDKNGCTSLREFTINEPEKGIIFEFTGKDTICKGSSDGSIKLIIPYLSDYKLSWDGGYQGTVLNNLGKGVYSLTLTDKNACVYSHDFIITELDNISLELNQKPATCHDFSDGTAWVDKVFYGGRETSKSKFNFVWDTPDPQHGQYAYYLKGGNIYTVSGIDIYGCESSAGIAIGNPPEIVTKVDSRKDVNCFGGNDGFISVIVPDCNNCRFRWSTNSKAGDTSVAMNLRSGLYKLTVTDENGCTVENTYTIVEPPPIDLSLKLTDVKCYNGTDGIAEISINGGAPPYSILWNDTLAAQMIDNLSAGKHYIVVTDINNCRITDTFDIQQPLKPITGFAESNDVTCFNGNDGTIHFEATGGSPPYSFSINGGQFYGTDVIVGLRSGNYNAMIKDINSCIFEIKNIYVSNGKQIKIELGNDTLVYFGSSVTITPQINGQTNPVQYEWTVPEGVKISCSDCPSPEVEIKFNTEIRVKITDSNGCSAEDSKNIRILNQKEVFVPEAFNPYSFHHSNSKLFIYGKTGIKIISFSVFDIWGGEVYNRKDFEINDESTGWDGTFRGKNLNAGGYPWILEIRHTDGTTEIIKGVVTLLK